MNIGSFPAVGPNQIQTIGLDFGSWLSGADILTGSPTVNVTVKFGSDSSPQSRIISGPSLGTVPVSQGGTGISNAAIVFQFGNCIVGVQYIIDAFCDVSNGDRVEASTIIACIAPGG